MRDEKAKYLMIDVLDISKQLYSVERVFAFNDFDNVYTLDRVITAKEIFDKYNISEEF